MRRHDKTSPTSTKVTAEQDGPTFPWAALALFVHEVDTKLHKLAEKAATTADESSLSLHLSLMELEGSWTAMQAKLDKQIDAFHQLEARAQTATDEIKVQAHLAKAEILAAAQETREGLRKIENRLHAFKVKSESDASKVLKRLSSTFLDLSRRLDGGP